MSSRNQTLRSDLELLYAGHDELLFHGWYHIKFVARKCLEFVDEVAANGELLEAAALTHNLNFIVDVKSRVEAGRALCSEYLQKAGYVRTEIAEIEEAVHATSVSNRIANTPIPAIAMALADANMLFKVLPVGTIILFSKYIAETKVDIRKWADKIISEQQTLLDHGVYSLTEYAKDHYSDWATVNLKLIETIRSSLDDPDVRMLLDDCKELGYI